jgi:hypothetical protein
MIQSFIKIKNQQYNTTKLMEQGESANLIAFICQVDICQILVCNVLITLFLDNTAQLNSEVYSSFSAI